MHVHVSTHENAQLANAIFFEIWVLWGYAGFSALFASGCLGWLLLGWILAPAGSVFGTPGWIWAAAGLHFESFVSLWGEPDALEAQVAICAKKSEQ